MHRRLECVSQWASGTECADEIFNFRSDELFILVLRAFFTVNVPSLQLSIIKLCVLPRLMSYLLLWPVNSVSTCPVRAPSFVGISDACATDFNRPTHTRIKWWIWIFRLLILIEEKNLIWNECCSASSMIVHSLLTVGCWRLLVWWICIDRSTAATHISIRNFMNPINVKIKLFVHCVDRIHFHGARMKPDFCNRQICAPRWFCKIHRYTGRIACNAKYRVINANNNEFIDRKVPTTYFYYSIQRTEKVLKWKYLNAIQVAYAREITGWR